MKLALTGILAAFLTTATGPVAKEVYTIQLVEGTFYPRNVVIQAGVMVSWKNVDTADHRVVSWTPATLPDAQDGPLFDSGPIKPGGSFEYAFLKPGRFEYSCRLHSGITGVVVVLPVP